MTGLIFAAGFLPAALGLAGADPHVPLDPAGTVGRAEAVSTDSIPGQEAPRGPEIIRTDRFSMTLGSRLQVRYTFLDPEQGGSNGSFAVQRARLSLGGDAYDHFRYHVQLELAGSEGARLIDANLRYRLAPMATLWVGQGKAYFGRQQLTSSGDLTFVDRTAVDGRFSAGRQAGIALVGQDEGRAFGYAVGVYNGTGISRANDNGRHMFVGRAVLTPLGAYAPVESSHDYPDSPRVSLGVAGLRTTEGAGAAKTRVTRLNAEGAFKVRGFNVTGEYYHEEAEPRGTEKLETTGWYAQGGYLLSNRTHELAVRYAVLSPNVAGNADVVETGLALSHYLEQHRAKIQADIRNVERKALDANDREFRLQVQLTL